MYDQTWDTLLPLRSRPTAKTYSLASPSLRVKVLRRRPLPMSTSCTPAEVPTHSAAFDGSTASYTVTVAATIMECSFYPCPPGYVCSYSGYCVRASRLFHDLHVARGDGSYTRLLARLAKEREKLAKVLDGIIFIPRAVAVDSQVIEQMKCRYNLLSQQSLNNG